ncbi:MAG: hypothetical protein NXY57DRAFT_443431 [Lentinula lateritia]|uniref:Uncharacterized protein n=1 Tax=Lentinula lateritia TaxID=40482 RepID=A0ABQ8VPW9_9AGAR|nr:MAG: hypothetical protein NXY57DRAFT_443431 [Lentinula lateritia]KAJ4498438.1 hypothetical protein C8R41DRAFT_864887 [Lentinula lateritia]
MGPKVHHRTTSSSRLGPNSRNTSATRLGANLQLTQKDPQFNTNKQPQPAQSKKNALGTHDNHGRTSTFQRINSSHRVASKDQLPPFQPVSKRPTYTATAKSNGTKVKRGFIIASSPSDEADDDEWVSSESGAATPNYVEGSDSGAESELVTPAEMTKLLERPPSTKTNTTKEMVEEQDRGRADGGVTPIPRVDIARPPQTLDPQLPRGKLPAEPELDLLRPAPPPPPAASQNYDRRASLPPMVTMINSVEPSPIDTPAVAPRPSHKRRPSTRPPSTHSISSRHEPLRPHPLIRGQSFGFPNNKQLAPLAMTSDVASAQLSSTPPVNIEQSRHHPSPLSSSPATTISGSPPSPSNNHNSLHHQLPSRRTSISSARSVATLPAHTPREPPRQGKDRNRTISTISISSSSAAISSLAHIPATRPPSPQRLSVVFPPPSHPQFHTAGVHSLLPPPYLTNHLTTLAHRTPLRESYDRVRYAKLIARR